MKRTQNAKVRGILGDVLRPRAMSVQEKQILDRAYGIRRQHSSIGRVNAALEEIRSYVLVSNHTIPKKIENLKADLLRAQNPRIKRALKKAIAELQQ